MKRHRLSQMSKVTEALYLSEFRKVQDILAEEARLRGELRRLQEQSQDGQHHMSGDPSMRTVGADLLWQAWLMRTQRQLNIELSQVMANKEIAMGSVRKAFGRQSAVQSMHQKEETAHRHRARKRALQALLRETGGG